MGDRDPSSIHGSAAVIGTCGLLIRGASGSGKSDLIWALIDAAQDSGRHACWIADDRVRLRGVNGRLIAGAPKPIAAIAEMCHLGIVGVDGMRHGIIDRVVDLTAEPPERMPEQRSCLLLGISLPLLILPQRRSAPNCRVIRHWLALSDKMTAG